MHGYSWTATSPFTWRRAPQLQRETAAPALIPKDFQLASRKEAGVGAEEVDTESDFDEADLNAVELPKELLERRKQRAEEEKARKAKLKATHEVESKELNMKLELERGRIAEKQMREDRLKRMVVDAMMAESRKRLEKEMAAGMFGKGIFSPEAAEKEAEHRAATKLQNIWKIKQAKKAALAEAMDSPGGKKKKGKGGKKKK